MTAVTVKAKKSITGQRFMEVAQVTAQNGYTYAAKSGNILGVQVSNNTDTTAVGATFTGSTVTVAVASGTKDVTLTIFYK